MAESAPTVPEEKPQVPPVDFVHLHCHTVYSALDGGSKPEMIPARLDELGMDAMACTDHGNLQCWPSFEKEMKKAGKKPILGCELYLTPDRHNKGRETPTYHLTVLAENNVGMKNLMKISTYAYTEGLTALFGRPRPRADFELLERYSSGLIVFTGCMASPTMSAIFRGDLAQSRKEVERLVAIFGAENVYGEVQNVGITEQIPAFSELAYKLKRQGENMPPEYSPEKRREWEQRLAILTQRQIEEDPQAQKISAVLERMSPLSQNDANRELAAICKDVGIELVATGDLHYLRESDAFNHDSMICLGTGQIPQRGPRKFSLLPQRYHMRSEAEMVEALGEWPDALANTRKIADRCNAAIEYDKELLPKFPLPEEYQTVTDEQQTELHAFLKSGALALGLGGADAYELSERNIASAIFLRDLAIKGLLERLDIESYEQASEEYRQRLQFELAVVHRMGFDDYFNIVWDLLRHAHETGIPAGPGRGSAAGSLVAYCLSITQLDPLKYNLLFERFLNPDRISLPDMDLDFGTIGLEQMRAYARDKYNALASCDTAVAQVVTFSTFKAKGALKDSARVLAEPSDEGRQASLKLGNRLSGFIPTRPPDITLKQVWEGGSEMKSAYHGDPAAAEAIKLAGWLEGMVKTYGQHAAAVIIADHQIEEDVPLQVAYVKDKGTVLTTQWEMNACEAVGLLKMDFLGLRNLDIIDNTLEKIRHVRDIDLGNLLQLYTTLALDDKETYDLYARGETVGTFQFESSGMRQALTEVRPTEFNDLIALVALYRPGPMQNIPAYAARKHGKEQVHYPDPRVEEVLKETYGIVVYQESSMLVARLLAGFTPGEADELRKAIGKKLKDKMDALEPKFIEGCLRNGVSKKIAAELWDDNRRAADYSFNKCLSATTRVVLPDGTRLRISEAARRGVTEIMSMWPDGEVRPHKIARIVQTGRKMLYKVTTASGRQIKVTADHRLLTTEGYKEVRDMAVGSELITLPRISDRQREARRETMTRLAQRPERKQQDERARDRMVAYQATRPMEEKVDHMLKMHELHPDLTKNAIPAMHARLAELRATDSEWVRRHAEASLAAVRATYDTGPGFGNCSIASNGMWCASNHERAMCEWLIEQSTAFEMHKVLPNGRICDFYFDGLYWEMDGMDREDRFFADKYGELPYVVVTPEDYQLVVASRSELAHVENGDAIVSIEECGEGSTYDIEMAKDGPLNFIANGIVSHNSHAACYAFVAYCTGYLKTHYPEEYMASLLSSVMGDKDKPRLYLSEAKRMGIRVLPPDLNRSLRDFSVFERDDKPGEYEILFGLTALKGVGEGVVGEIRGERDRGGNFTSIYDLIRRMPQLNKGTLQSLIKGGALDSTSASRKAMHDVVEGALEAAKKAVRAKEKDFIKAVAVRIEDAGPLGGADLLLEAVGKKVKLRKVAKIAVDAGCIKSWSENRELTSAELVEAAEEALRKDEMRLARAEAKKTIHDQGHATSIADEEGEVLDLKTLVEQAATKAVESSTEERLERATELAGAAAAFIAAELLERADAEDLESVLADSADAALANEEWDHIEKLNYEREVLGIYVTGHPLDQDSKKWARYVHKGLGELSDEDIARHKDDTRRVVGALVGLEKKKTKRGDIWYIATVEDLTGARDITLFKSALEGKEELLEVGRVIGLEVKVEEDTFAQSKQQEADELASGGGEEGAEGAGESSAEIPIKAIARYIFSWQPDQIPESEMRSEAEAAIALPHVADALLAPSATEASVESPVEGAAETRTIETSSEPLPEDTMAEVEAEIATLPLDDGPHSPEAGQPDEVPDDLVPNAPVAPVEAPVLEDEDSMAEDDNAESGNSSGNGAGDATGVVAATIAQPDQSGNGSAGDLPPFIRIKVEPERFTEDIRNRLKAVFESSPGPVPVKIQIGDKTYGGITVMPTPELRDAVRDILHPVAPVAETA